MRAMFKYLLILLVFLSAVTITGYLNLGPVGGSSGETVFVVPEDNYDFNVPQKLKNQNLIRNEKAFEFIFNNFAPSKAVSPGGYKLNSNMNSVKILQRITGKPDFVWFSTTGCLRKEQIGEKIAGVLNWTDSELETWNTLYSYKNKDYYEGVYYPDKYLLPVGGSAADISKLFIDNFNQKFSPFANQALSKNIKWTTVLKIASLIEREAGGKSDMGIISGIIWNRLNSGMPLQIDATMQYTLGKKENGSWWGSVDVSEKQSDSPYNSYKYKGLPPTPICSPGVDAIEAAINPEDTDCLYYLHDSLGKIHCSKTYKEHLANIREFLRD